MTRGTVLLWLERGLFSVGAALALWCAIVLVEAHYTRNLPIPNVVVTQTIPPGAKSPAVSAPAPAPGAWVARLEVPALRLSTTVLEGTDDGTLRRGSGHIEDTPFPGQAGNVGIAGHRDTVFRPLRNVHVGDAMNVTTADHVYHYRITRTHIVGPDDVYVLDPTEHPTLTLVTCYPFEFIGHAPRRFIVHADLVSEEARAADAESSKSGKSGRSGG